MNASDNLGDNVRVHQPESDMDYFHMPDVWRGGRHCVFCSNRPSKVVCASVVALVLCLMLAGASGCDDNSKSGTISTSAWESDYEYFSSRVAEYDDEPDGLHPHIDELTDRLGEPDAKLSLTGFIAFCAKDPSTVGHYNTSPIEEAYQMYRLSGAEPYGEMPWRENEGFSRCRVWIYRWEEPIPTSLMMDRPVRKEWRIVYSYFFLVRQDRVITNGMLVRESKQIR